MLGIRFEFKLHWKDRAQKQPEKLISRLRSNKKHIILSLHYRLDEAFRLQITQSRQTKGVVQQTRVKIWRCIRHRKRTKVVKWCVLVLLFRTARPVSQSNDDLHEKNRQTVSFKILLPKLGLSQDKPLLFHTMFLFLFFGVWTKSDTNSRAHVYYITNAPLKRGFTLSSNQENHCFSND